MGSYNEGAQAYLAWQDKVDEALKANKATPPQPLCPYPQGSKEGTEWVKGFYSARDDDEY